MKRRLIRVAIGVCALAAQLHGQRGAVRPPGSPSRPPLGRPGGMPRWHSWRNDSHRWWSQPLLPVSAYSPFGGQSDFRPEPQAPIVLVVQSLPPAPPAPPPPPAPARALIQEFARPESTIDSAPAFAIVLNDGTVRRALAVCRQDSLLTFVTPDGAGENVELAAVDRDATRLANSRDLLQ